MKGDEPPKFGDDPTANFTGDRPRPGAQNEDTYGAIRALDPQTGEMKWEFRQNAQSTEAGILTTAGDVLFSGSRDGSFYALDARTGKLVWQTNLGPSIAAGPMSYSVNGKQYVSIQAGSALFTLGLQ